MSANGASHRAADGEDHARLVRQVLDLRADLVRSLRPARAWLDVDLTMSQVKVLFVLYSDGSASMGQLAASLGVTLSTVSGIVDRLVEHGVVQREENPHDRRLVVCRLTQRGDDTADRLYQAGQSQFADLLDDLAPAALRTVAEGLRILSEASHRQAAAEALAPTCARRSRQCSSRNGSGAVMSR
jgi:DNA-binding MarR family transcriptional regulator